MVRFFKTVSPKLWFFIFSLLFFIVSIARLPFAGADSDEALVRQFDRNFDVTLQEAVVTYHTNLNTLFNDSLELLFSGQGTFEPPEGDDCPDKNVSTYCVALRAVEQYDAFFEGLQTHRGFFLDPNDERTENTITLEQALNVYGDRDDAVNEQLVIAQETLDTTLAAYNEIQVFYPLHEKYTALIKELEKYRDALAKVRREIEKYPGKFQNVTTTKCT